MQYKRKEYTQEEKEEFGKSMDRFKDAMEIHDENLRGQVIAINFKKKVVVKSKCRKGKMLKKAA